MQVAVCVSGQMRTFRRTYKSLWASIIKPYNADVFVHTWDNAGTTNKLILSLPKGFHIALPREYWHDNPDVLSENAVKFKEILPNFYSELQSIADVGHVVTQDAMTVFYNPVKCVIETFEAARFNETLGIIAIQDMVPDKTFFNAAPMFYKIYACDQLRQAHEREIGKKYDVVIRTRPDLYFSKVLPIDTKTIAGRLETLHNPFYEIVGASNLSNDMFFIGDSETMAYATALWEDLPRIWNPAEMPEWPFAQRGPERALYHHLARHGLQDQIVKIEPPPYRVVGQVTYERMLELVELDLKQKGSLPEFVGLCVSICQSICGVDAHLSGDKSFASRILAEPLTIGSLRFPAPFIGRAKVAAINGDEAAMRQNLAAARDAGQDSVYPELTSK